MFLDKLFDDGVHLFEVEHQGDNIFCQSFEQTKNCAYRFQYVFLYIVNHRSYVRFLDTASGFVKHQLNLPTQSSPSGITPS